MDKHIGLTSIPPRYLLRSVLVLCWGHKLARLAKCLSHLSDAGPGRWLSLTRLLASVDVPSGISYVECGVVGVTESCKPEQGDIPAQLVSHKSQARTGWEALSVHTHAVMPG